VETLDRALFRANALLRARVAAKEISDGVWVRVEGACELTVTCAQCGVSKRGRVRGELVNEQLRLEERYVGFQHQAHDRCPGLTVFHSPVSTEAMEIYALEILAG
jgi:hypothetical protein